MLRLTLAQMRRSTGRLIAAGVAIAIGTAFVAATLLASQVLTRTTHDAVTADVGDADLVLTEGVITEATLADAALTPGVAGLHGYTQAATEVAGPDGRTYLPLTATTTDPRLGGPRIASGETPDGPDEVALPARLAELLGVGVGDTVEATSTVWLPEAAAGSAADASAPDAGGTPQPVEQVDRLRVVGLVDSSNSTFLGTSGVGLVDPVLLQRLLALDPALGDAGYWYATAVVTAGADPAAVRDRLQRTLGPALQVRTMAEHAEVMTEQVTGSADALTAVVLGFAAVALLVAGLVITNTFAVLVAQRTRTLALLRCVGATRTQVRRSVVQEALALGVISSTVGLALGAAVVQVALLVLRAAGPDVPLPATITVTPAVVAVPLLVGCAVTVLAAGAPARAATRVAPLAALRPVAVPTSRGTGRARAWAAGALTVGGLLGLAAGIAAARLDLLLGLAIGVLGGTASFVGVVLGAVLWVPAVVGRVGALVGRRAGPTARLTAANAVRNPHRTASTTSALLIGVTLVAMMTTGAASARSALTRSLTEAFPVDLAVMGPDGAAGPALPDRFTRAVAAQEGVQGVAILTGASLEIVSGARDGGTWTEAVAGAPEAVRGVVGAREQVAALADGTVVVPEDLASSAGIRDGASLVLRQVAVDDLGAPVLNPGGAPTLTVTADVTALPGYALVLTSRALATVAPDAAPSTLWVRLTDDASAQGALDRVTALATESGEALQTLGPAVERAHFQRVVDTLLAVVVGLLAVAVVIALIGVANTLSLSVLERRRESATLRAIGLSRGRLRRMLAIEGMLIAGVGAVAGVGLGAVYGWAGTQTVLSDLGTVRPVLPWAELAAVVAVAVVAGLLASILPGRAAARTSPVAALAVE